MINATSQACATGPQAHKEFASGIWVLLWRLRSNGCSDCPSVRRLCRAAEEYLRSVVRHDHRIFNIESAVRSGSPNLQCVVGNDNRRLRANDTSFGAGFAPYSPLERTVLNAGQVLCSDGFRAAFPAAGDDYKVMGARIGTELGVVVALAFVDRAVRSVKDYFEVKAEITKHLKQALGLKGRLLVNALDDAKASNESGIYLTATGLSAEHGDDGQVGRGNRVNGLITPSRAMSLEAAAGKNSVAHVGKLYNLLAHRIAHTIADSQPSLREASVQLLSTIGKPVGEPDLVAIRLMREPRGKTIRDQEVLRVAHSQLRDITLLSQDLLEGRIKVF
jgi:S-adenosylmethionine synthetase